MEILSIVILTGILGPTLYFGGKNALKQTTRDLDGVPSKPKKPVTANDQDYKFNSDKSKDNTFYIKQNIDLNKVCIKHNI